MANKNQHNKKKTFVKEENAIILDYLSLGYVNDKLSNFKRKPIAQAIGCEKFTLLELIPKPNPNIEIHEKVYIGPGKRDKIKTVKKLQYENLTATSRIELDYAIRDIVEANEAKYVEFFNTTESVSTRLHSLELIPGIGKKYMWDIINAREEKPFESFKDSTERLPTLTDPAGMIVNRVKQELDTTTIRRGNKGKYYIFTQPPKRPRNSR